MKTLFFTLILALLSLQTKAATNIPITSKTVTVNTNNILTAPTNLVFFTSNRFSAYTYTNLMGLTNAASWRAALDAAGPTNISGSNSYVAKFVGTNAITNSLMYDSGTSIGIGTNNPSARLHIQGTSTTDGPVFSSEFLGASGWTSTGWSGSWAGGWTHTAGNTTPLSQSTTAVVGTNYQISYTVTGVSAGSFTISFGGQTSPSGINASGAWGPKATAITGLSITPTSDFNGTIVISIRYLAGASTPILVLTDSTSAPRIEARTGYVTNNTFIGKGSGQYSTTGTNNTGIGSGAMQFLTTGDNNTAEGVNALYSFSTGDGNTAQGRNSLFSLISGTWNTAQGNSPIYSLITGIYNTAQGNAALYGLTNGSYNTVQGANAGRSLTSGESNVFIGMNAGLNASQLTTSTNSIAIGAGSFTTANNQAVIGSTNITTTVLNGNVGIGTNNPSARLQIQGTSATDGPVYAAEFLGASGWTSTGWSGSWAGGWTHTAGNTTPLSQSTAAVASTKYLISYTVTGGSAGNFYITFGGMVSDAITVTGSWGPTAISTASLSITPTSDFDRTIVISIRAITGPSTPAVLFTDSGGTGTVETRVGYGANSIFIGTGAGSFSSGVQNIAIGERAGESNTTGLLNVSIGGATGRKNTTGSFNTASGGNTLRDNVTGSFNTALGYDAIQFNTSGSYGTAIGTYALRLGTSGSYNTALGSYSLYNATGNNNSALGNSSGYSLTTGYSNVFIGVNSGYHASQLVTATNSIAIGADSYTVANNQAVLGNTNITTTLLNGNVGIGTNSPTSRIHILGTSAMDGPVYSSEFLGAGGWTSTGWSGSWAAGWTHTAGNTTALLQSTAPVAGTRYQITYTVTGVTGGSFTIDFGGQSLSGISASGAWGPTAVSTASLSITPLSAFDGKIVISIRYLAGPSTPVMVLADSSSTSRIEARTGYSDDNTFIGKGSGQYSTTGLRNTGVGSGALQALTTGNNDVAQGYYALYAVTTGNNNTAQGNVALYSLTNGSYNTAQGNAALYSLTNGSYNSAQGVNAGRTLNSGYSNVFIGVNAGYHASQLVTATNSIAIGADTYTTTNNQVVLGNTNITTTALNGNVGLGTYSPRTKLEVMDGTLRLGVGSSAVSFLDFGYWYPGSGYGMSYVFKITDPIGGVTGFNALNIYQNGNIGVGFDYPLSKLAVNGGVHVGGASDPGDNNLSVDGITTLSDKLTWGINLYGAGDFAKKILAYESATAINGWSLGAGAFGTEFRQFVNGTGSGANAFVFGVATNTTLTFSERMRITESGNVGMYFSSPLARLAINGGLHVGGESDPGDNNLLVDGNAVANTMQGYLNISSRGTTSTNGYIDLSVGSDSAAGYMGVYRPVGSGPPTRLGYIGYLTNYSLFFYGDNYAYPFYFSGAPTIVDGTLSVKALGVVADTATYGIFGVTRATDHVIPKSYIAFTRDATSIWGLGKDANNAFVMGNADNSKNIPSPVFTMNSSGILTITSNLVVGGQIILTNTVWDDLQIPGHAVKTGGTAPTFGDFVNTSMQAWLFQGSVNDDQVWFTAQMSHSYKTGTDLHPHIHWTETAATGAGTNVVWELYYSWQDIGKTYTAGTTLLITNSVTGTNWTHQLSEFPPISGSGITGVSSIINCRLRRLANSNASDTYDQNAAFLQFDFHYQKDGVGSINETSK